MILPFLMAVLAMQVDSSWQLSMDKGNIQVFHRSIPGWSLDEFRGIGIDSIPIEVGFQVLMDLPAYTEWVPYLVESRVIRQIDVDTLLVYHKYDLPWPFSDRDIVVKAIINRKNSEGIMSASLVAEDDSEIPIPQGCIRIKRMVANVELRNLSASVTQGIYTERIELGGSVPNWLNRLFSKEIPYTILQKLSQQCKKTIILKQKSGT